MQSGAERKSAAWNGAIEDLTLPTHLHRRGASAAELDDYRKDNLPVRHTSLHLLLFRRILMNIEASIFIGLVEHVPGQPVKWAGSVQSHAGQAFEKLAHDWAEPRQVLERVRAIAPPYEERVATLPDRVEL